MVRRVKIEMAAKKAALISLIICIITSSGSFMFMVPGCQNTNLAGVITPYYNQSVYLFQFLRNDTTGGRQTGFIQVEEGKFN